MTNKINNLIKSIIDKMIPPSKEMPCASEVIEIKSFVKKILKKDNNKSILNKKNPDVEMLEKNIQEELIEEYFTSKKVLKILEKKTDKFISMIKQKRKKSSSIVSLTRSVKKVKIDV